MKKIFVAGLMALLLVGCLQVSDSPFFPLGHGMKECHQACKDQSKAQKKVEQMRFKTAVKNCKTDDCKAREEKMHEDIIDQINADMSNCNRNCHHQGGGGSNN